jgi:hypothetical protein
MPEFPSHWDQNTSLGEILQNARIILYEDLYRLRARARERLAEEEKRPEGDVISYMTKNDAKIIDMLITSHLEENEEAIHG